MSEPGRLRVIVFGMIAMLSTAVLAAASPFENVVNEPFATVANGPQGAIVVDEAAISTMGAGDPISRAIDAQHDLRSLRRAAHSLETLKRLGLKSPRAEARFPRRLVHVANGRIVAPDLMRTMQAGDGLGDPANQLRFTFEGFDEGTATSFRDYLSRALPVAYSVYGRPAFDLDVTVILDEELDALQGGIYDATTNEIRLAPPSGNFTEDSFILLVMVLQAFHDDAAFFYDAWEQGFAGAAATVIQTRPGVAPGYNPIDPGPFFATSVYEAQNQQALGGPTFFPDSGWAGMLVWRIAMSRSAWFKCWVEDPDFFRNFNEAYYAAFTPSLPGDIPALRVLASEVLPSVEGLPFQEWYQRQWVLDTSVRIGPKLFVWNIPLTQSVALIAEYFYTTFEGDEEPRGGQARTIYWSYDFRTSLYAEEGNTISIPATGDGAGEGFLIPTFFNIGGPQNITVQVDLNALRLMLPFPYGQRGFEAGENNLYGSIIGASDGAIDVEGGTGLEDVPVHRGVWGDRITEGPLSPRQIRVTFTNQNQQEFTRVFNVAYDSYVTFLHGNEQDTLTRTWSGAPPGLHLISFPVRPLNQDLADLLGVAPDRLLVARWEPTSPGENKYQIWPRMEPVQPGRAYWLRVFDTVTVNLQGVLEPQLRPVVIPLAVGWNMIGPPRTQAVAVADLQFQAGGETAVGYDEAVQQGIIQDGIFGFSSDEGYTLRDTLQPFEGYWIRCLRADGALLRFPAVSTSAGQPTGRPRSAGNLQWSMPIVAEAGGMRSSALIGVAEDAVEGVDRHDLQAPPGFGPRVSVELYPAGSDSAGLYRDVRPAGSTRLVYTMRVSSTRADLPVNLRWPDMTDVPENLAPLLIDEASGRRLYMRTTSGMQLAAGEDGVDRRLRIELHSREGQPLMISSLSALQPNCGAAQITFTLSAPAQVQAEILNIAGRSIRRLAASAQAPGQSTLSWNLRDNGGRMVPNGTYLVRLRARDDEGRQAQAIRPLRISR